MPHDVGELGRVGLRDLLDQRPEGWSHPIDEVIPERPLDGVGVGVEAGAGTGVRA